MRPIKAVRDLAPGTQFRLFNRYRDGQPRPRYGYGKRSMHGLVLHVVEHNESHTLVRAGAHLVPVWGGMGVLT